MSEGLDLLRRLTPIGQGQGAAALVRTPSSSTSSSAQGLDFAQMLDKAQAGDLVSGLTVHTAPLSGVELTPAQLARLSAAADKAEAQGATRAIALIDGQAVQMDVTTRTVLGKADLSAGKTITNIDSVIVVPDEGATGPGVGGPAKDATKLNTTLMDVLKKSELTK